MQTELYLEISLVWSKGSSTRSRMGVGGNALRVGGFLLVNSFEFQVSLFNIPGQNELQMGNQILLRIEYGNLR